jgi:hypothetical protein
MKSLEVSIISEHGNIESCSLLKNNNLEEFIEKNIPRPEEDEDKTKGSFSFSLSPLTVIVHLAHKAYELGFP